MRYRGITCVVACLIALPALAQFRAGGGKVDPPKGDNGYDLNLMRKLYRPEPVNGVLLQASVRIQPRQDADKIVLDWTLDYEGPRSPLIILEPSLEFTTRGQTVLMFLAKGKNGIVHAFDVASPNPDPFRSPAMGSPSWAKKEWFVTIDKKKALTRSLDVSARKVRDHFTVYYPDQYEASAPELHVMYSFDMPPMIAA